MRTKNLVRIFFVVYLNIKRKQHEKFNNQHSNRIKIFLEIFKKRSSRNQWRFLFRKLSNDRSQQQTR